MTSTMSHIHTIRTHLTSFLDFCTMNQMKTAEVEMYRNFGVCVCNKYKGGGTTKRRGVACVCGPTHDLPNHFTKKLDGAMEFP